MSKVKLYSPETFSECRLVSHPLYSYIEAILLAGLPSLIANITNASCYALEVGEKLTLVVVAEAQAEQAYPTSLRAQYLDYAQEELELTGIKGAPLLTKVFDGLKWILPKGLDRVVYIGNFLLSTNLFEAFSVAELRGIEAVLMVEFPGRTLVYRSQTPLLNQQMMTDLSSLGYQPFISRQVYLAQDAKVIKKKKSFQKDRSLARRTELIVTSEFDVASYADRIIELYTMLYLEKYSLINPQYTTAFIKAMIKVENTQFTGIFDRKKLVGVTMSWSLQNVMTVPILGYDLAYPQASGLYRLLTYYTLAQVDEAHLFHMSSGVGPYKLSRGAVYYPEYLYYKRSKQKSRGVWVNGCLRLFNRVLVKLSSKRAF